MSAIRPAEEGREAAGYAWLLLAIVLMLGIPAVLGWIERPVPGFQLVSTAVLVAALFSLGHGRYVRWGGIALAVPALLSEWGAWATGSRGLDVASGILVGAFLSLVTITIFGALLNSTRVTIDTILGGVCVYLLLGVVFMTAFSTLERVAPGSLFEAGVPISGGSDSVEAFRLPQLLYYSFVTLSTLGYGDIVPVSPAARGLAAAEAVLGQLYIAVFVARLVGLHLVQDARR